MTKDILLEVIALDLDDAKRAADGGADRIEVCAGMDRDGTTPSLNVIEAICGADLPLNVMAMVRPRGGDFEYAPHEIDAMSESIRAFKGAGVDGVVIGCLSRDGRIDATALETLMDAAEGLSVTFHRAFDAVTDARLAVDALVDARVDRVLTLGYPVGAPRQPTDPTTIRNQIEIADGRLAVMTGGWLTDDSSGGLRAAGVREFHLGRAIRYDNTYDQPIDPTSISRWKATLNG